MKYEEAVSYLNSCEKYGVSIGADIKDLSESDTIELAEHMIDGADAAYDEWKETWEYDTYDKDGCDPGGHPNAEVIAKRLNI